MALPKALRYAVLHVGSSSMSITILEYKGIDDVRVIDYAAREVTFGEELFQTSRLSFKTIEEICHILKGYKFIDINNIEVTEQEFRIANIND